MALYGPSIALCVAQPIGGAVARLIALCVAQPIGGAVWRLIALCVAQPIGGAVARRLAAQSERNAAALSALRAEVAAMEAELRGRRHCGAGRTER